MPNEITCATAADPPVGRLQLFVTGGSGVLGRALLPVAAAAGHVVDAPHKGELDLFDARAVRMAMQGADAIVHLASRIQPLDRLDDPDAWRDNDRLRTEASRILVDAAIEVGAHVYIQPTVTFVYPDEGPVDESTPVVDRPILRSALDAERETERFAADNGRGVVLRLGLLDGPGTGNDRPRRRFGATLHVVDAGSALLAALSTPSGLYNVCRDGERVSNLRFRHASGWHPCHGEV